MDDKVYPNFLQGFFLTLGLVIILVSSYALESIPLHLKIKVPTYFISLVLAFSSLLYIPVIYYALKKSRINILSNFDFPGLKLCCLLILFAISVRILSLPLIDPVIFTSSFLNNQLEYSFFKPLVMDTNFIIKLINGILLAPVLEEIFFRGILLQQFLKQYSPWKAILLSSLIFTFAHLRYIDVGYLMVSGIAFGYVFYKTNSVVASMIVHSSGNLLWLVTKYYKTPLDDSSLQKLFFILSASILVVYLFVKYIDRLQNKQPENIWPVPNQIQIKN